MYVGETLESKLFMRTILLVLAVTTALNLVAEVQWAWAYWAENNNLVSGILTTDEGTDEGNQGFKIYTIKDFGKSITVNGNTVESEIDKMIPSKGFSSFSWDPVRKIPIIGEEGIVIGDRHLADGRYVTFQLLLDPSTFQGGSGYWDNQRPLVIQSSRSQPVATIEPLGNVEPIIDGSEILKLTGVEIHHDQQTGIQSAHIYGRNLISGNEVIGDFEVVLHLPGLMPQTLKVIELKREQQKIITDFPFQASYYPGTYLLELRTHDQSDHMEVKIPLPGVFVDDLDPGKTIVELDHNVPTELLSLKIKGYDGTGILGFAPHGKARVGSGVLIPKTNNLTSSVLQVTFDIRINDKRLSYGSIFGQSQISGASNSWLNPWWTYFIRVSDGDKISVRVRAINDDPEVERLVIGSMQLYFQPTGR